ncbi:hypothetical protein [Leuconostoc gasicomitatum]|uniref:hypothetical protein n=1 Tax=Leuconostoc gasicomitatum TaxID=115778 RepID=UPI001CC397D2|nr:hypothetical protein [Leuconostoc gasicomitatum]MBZ5998522.1 hypothetical protein [Leuconostoc gasicomitatum]
MSEEMKPVAYIWQTGSGEYLGVSRNISTSVNIPLYTKQQLQPRVKMTQAEFDEFKDLLSVGIGTIYEAFDVISSGRGELNEFDQLYNRLFTHNVISQSKKQIEFSKLWDSLSTSLLEETIEITSEKKWFVRSKELDSDGDWAFLNGIEKPDDWGYSRDKEDVKNPRNIAYPFETKEQAELWTNPLTEAVLLPVGDE